MVDTVAAHSQLCKLGPVLLDVRLPRCSRTVAIPLSSPRVSYSGSKLTVVIIISLISVWFRIWHVMHSWPVGSLRGFLRQCSPS